MSTLRTSASVPLLLIVPVTGVSEISINSATAPNVPYELLPLVARILPPFSAR